jgi:hypothetical protein
MVRSADKTEHKDKREVSIEFVAVHVRPEVRICREGAS